MASADYKLSFSYKFGDANFHCSRGAMEMMKEVDLTNGLSYQVYTIAGAFYCSRIETLSCLIFKWGQVFVSA